MTVSGVNTSVSAKTVAQPPTEAQRDLDRLRETSGQIVGRMFYGTLLKTMRESTLQGTIGHGGRGEAVFAEQLHGAWSEQIGTASRNGLADVLYDSLKRQQERISSSHHEQEESKL